MEESTGIQETRNKKIGMSAGVYFDPKNPLNLLVVPNTKTRTAINKLLNENGHPTFRDRREELAWARKMWERLGERPPKADKFGLPGGEIWGFEVTDNPERYGEIALAREFVEETGLIVNKERLIGGAPMFQPDREELTGGYENHFFLVEEAEGELHKKGVPEETGPPVFKPVTELQPWNFYPKHCVPLIKVLAELVEAGGAEYAQSLGYLQKVFAGRLPVLREKPDFRLAPPALPDNLTDDERFSAAMQQLGVKK